MRVNFFKRPVKRIGEISSNSKDGRRRLLVLWWFEHKLKLVYERFLRAIEGLASLVVEDLSKRALRTALNLLAERPEGERVNKMGHPKTQIGAFVATLLEDLTKRQPRMRPIIVAEVERLIYSNVLDLILSTSNHLIKNLRILPPVGNSDHCGISCEVAGTESLAVPVYRRAFSACNFTDLFNYLAQLRWVALLETRDIDIVTGINTNYFYPYCITL
ncbi:hypothetical protein COOONC_17823 [Cooperia oncophora]